VIRETPEQDTIFSSSFSSLSFFHYSFVISFQVLAFLVFFLACMGILHLFLGTQLVHHDLAINFYLQLYSLSISVLHRARTTLPSIRVPPAECLCMACPQVCPCLPFINSSVVMELSGYVFSFHQVICHDSFAISGAENP
jgi:hypothetical protein